jgi:hypothetical protein
MSLVDIPASTAEDQTMDPSIKDYVDTKLESAEARAAASMVDFKSFVTATLARMEERDKAAEARDADRQLADRTRSAQMQRQLDEFRRESRTTRKATVITGITATLTILFGTAAINAAIVQNFHNAFDIGQRHSTLISEMTTQSQRTGTVLARMDVRLEKLDTRLTEVDTRLAAMEKSLDRK